MTEVCEKSPEMRELAKKVLKDREDLAWIRDARVRIGYETSDKEKRSKGKNVFGECTKVKEKYKPWTPYDFLITFYTPNTDLLTEEQREILMYHELLHVGMRPTGAYYVVPHDVEDFKAVLDKYGVDWAHVEVGDMDGT